MKYCENNEIPLGTITYQLNPKETEDLSPARTAINKVSKKATIELNAPDVVSIYLNHGKETMDKIIRHELAHYACVSQGLPHTHEDKEFLDTCRALGGLMPPTNGKARFILARYKATNIWIGYSKNGQRIGLHHELARVENHPSVSHIESVKGYREVKRRVSSSIVFY